MSEYYYPKLDVKTIKLDLNMVFGNIARVSQRRIVDAWGETQYLTITERKFLGYKHRDEISSYIRKYGDFYRKIGRGLSYRRYLCKEDCV